MNISSNDTAGFLVRQATAMQGSRVQQQIGVAVLKQTLDQQKAAGASIVQLIEAATAQVAANGRLDIRV